MICKQVEATILAFQSASSPQLESFFSMLDESIDHCTNSGWLYIGCLGFIIVKEKIERGVVCGQVFLYMGEKFKPYGVHNCRGTVSLSIMSLPC